MEKYILALDQGTTSSRAILFDNAGNIVGVQQQEFAQFYPNPGEVEHDPLEIWHTQLSAAQLVLKNCGISANQVAAIGISNQRETTIVWDKATGMPLYNAIVWQDRRTAFMVDELKQKGYADKFLNKTGLVLDAYFSGTKLKWILDHTHNGYEKARRGQILFGTVDSWLVWNLTGGKEHVTDVSNASRTLLYNIHTHSWDDELLEILQIPKEILPRVVASMGVIGQTAGELFGSPISISGVIGDQQSATFGNLCIKPGMVKNTYGTGCFLLMNTGDKALSSNHNLLTTVGWKIKEQYSYCLEGSIFMGGALTQWIRDELGFISKSDQIEQLALQVPDNGGVYLIPAFTGLGAPNWDQYARGTIFGLTRGSNKSHIARAALESIAFGVYDLVNCIKQDTQQEITTLRVDGGACKNNLLMQFQADILNTVVERPKCLELSAMGAAFLAGLAVGFWDSISQLEQIWSLDRRFEPQMQNEKREELLYMWHKALGRSLNWIEGDKS